MHLHHLCCILAQLHRHRRHRNTHHSLTPAHLPPSAAAQGVLALNVPVPGLRRHFLLTKTLEWNLYW